MSNSILRDKSFLFAIRIVRLSQDLQKVKEFVLSKQILRSGTAVGALIAEAEFGQSKPDFIHKMNIALKEANETTYWLLLLRNTGFMNELIHKSLASDCTELIKMLIATIKTSKKSIGK